MKNMIKYKDFFASIYYEDTTSTFWGKVEGIEDVITFESNTIEGLKKEFKNMDRFKQTKTAGLLGIIGNLFLLIIKGTTRIYI